MSSNIERYPSDLPRELFNFNRQKVLANVENKVLPNSVIILAGGNEATVYDTDVSCNFRQESFFYWLFGVSEPGYFGCIHVGSQEAILFMPRFSPDFEIWIGSLRTPEEVRRRYGVDRVFYADEMLTQLKKIPTKLLVTMSGVNKDSNLPFGTLAFDGINHFEIDDSFLYSILSECRVFKSDMEIQALKKASAISCNAHRLVMLKARPGMYEFQLEAIFRHYGFYTSGCKNTAYPCICGTGKHSSYLHYGHPSDPNEKLIKDGEMCLLDMGISYRGYASDITISFPINGKFTDRQKMIYNIVLESRNAVMSAMGPGISWIDMHLLANKIVLKGLLDAGILQGDLDHMMSVSLAHIFQPHGLGHLLGLDVHDVGGYTEDTPPRPAEPGLDKLRTARNLCSGMVITVEPGCYFIDHCINTAIEDPILSPFLVKSELFQYANFGGVRIEDVVLITDEGIEVLSADLPRTVEEIENWMQKGRDQPEMCEEYFKESHFIT